MRQLIDSRWPAMVTLASMVIWITPIMALQNRGDTTLAKTDQTISDHIEDELLFDQAVLSHKIDISTDQGIVQLAGDVDNLLARKRAAKIAMSVRGVRSVVNNIDVKPPTDRSDSAILDDIESALLTNQATESFEITPTVSDGFVNLDGLVESWQEKQLAEKVASGVYGVRGVNNSIMVNHDTKRPDSELKREIREVFKWDVHIPNHNLITVNAEDGEVFLTGVVGSSSEKTRAYTQAWITGVKLVDHSDLKVEGWSADNRLRNDSYVDATDSEIKKAVIDAMLYDPRVNSFNVKADVENRSVTLRGEVDNLQAKRAARQNARNTAGVLNVTNRLKVRLVDPFPSDDEVERNVENALTRDPYVQSYEISTIAQNGEVSLYGTVDSFYEKSQAEDVASTVRGVVTVDNNIVVTNNTPFYYDPLVDDSPDYTYSWEFNSIPLKSDREIASEIESEIVWSPFVDSDQVEVTVDNGTATLTGTVDSWTERDSAQENAYEGGAIFVDNDLTVR